MSLHSRIMDATCTYMLVGATLSLPPFMALMFFQLVCTCCVISAVEVAADGTTGRE